MRNSDTVVVPRLDRGTQSWIPRSSRGTTIVNIIGAGIMGRLTAFSLVRAGYKNVCLFDQDDGSGNKGCSTSAAGLLTPISELDKSEMIIARLGKEAIHQHWPDIIKHLPNIYFNNTGSITVAHSQDHKELSHFMQRIAAKSSDGYRQIHTDELQTLEPDIKKFSHAYYFADEAQIDNQAVFHALGAYLHEHITWHKNTLINTIDNNADLTIDCRGLGAKTHYSDLRGVRGELIWLHAPQVKISRPIRLLHPRYSLYIAPRPNDIYIVGASEIESEDTSAISVKTTLELLTAAYSLHPGFAEARIINTAVNHRPTLADHLPKIKFKNKLIAVNGLYRHGYLIAPTLAQDVLHYLSRGITAVQYPELWEEYHD